CVGLLVARRLMAARPHQARWVASRRSGSRQTRTSLRLPTCLGSGLSLYTFEGRRTASFSTWATPIEANQCLVLATQPPQQHWPAKVISASGNPVTGHNVHF